MVGDMMGWQNLPRFPYAAEQGFGVYLGLLVFALWIGRSHFIGLVRHLFTASRSRFQLDDSREPMPYRLAVIGIVFGMIFLTVFSYKAGMSLWVIPIFFGIYFLLSIMITRLRAELGFIVHGHGYRPGIDPHTMIVTGFGTWQLTTNTLTVFSNVYVFQSCLLGQSDAGAFGSVQDVGAAEHQPTSYLNRHPACNSDRSGCEFLVSARQLLPTWA